MGILLKAAALAASLLLALPAQADLSVHRNAPDGSYPFWLYTPGMRTAGCPLIVFLHGRSLSGNKIERLLYYGTIDATRTHKIRLPAVVVAPVSPRHDGWRPEKVRKLIAWAQKRYRTDPSRVYLLGMSMGGFGTLDYAVRYPQTVAAAMALCGGSYASDVKPLGDVPLWVIHGTADEKVPIEYSRRVVRELRGSGRDSLLIYDEWEGARHGTLSRLFYDQRTYDWLLSHRLTERRVNRSIQIPAPDMSRRKPR